MKNILVLSVIFGLGSLQNLSAIDVIPVRPGAHFLLDTGDTVWKPGGRDVAGWIALRTSYEDKFFDAYRSVKCYFTEELGTKVRIMCTGFPRDAAPSQPQATNTAHPSQDPISLETSDQLLNEIFQKLKDKEAVQISKKALSTSANHSTIDIQLINLSGDTNEELEKAWNNLIVMKADQDKEEIKAWILSPNFLNSSALETLKSLFENELSHTFGYFKLYLDDANAEIIGHNLLMIRGERQVIVVHIKYENP